MPCAAEVGMAEAHDGAVFVLITGAVFIHPRLVHTIDVMWHSVSVGAELHDAERRTSPREGMSHTVGTDDGIDVLDVIGGGFWLGGHGGLFAATEGQNAKENE